MRLRALFAAALLASSAGASASAAPASAPPPDVTLDQAVALYHANNPRLAAARAAIDVTAADLIDADTYPNPSISASQGATVHGVATSGDTVTSAELDVPILFGKRKHRADAAGRRVDAARAQAVAGEADGAREVERRFTALLAAQERVAAVTSAVEDARRVRTIVAGRAQAGAKSPYDLERTDLALAGLENRLADAQTSDLEASGELAEAIGIPSWEPHAVGTFRPAEAPGPAMVDPAHPALARTRAAEAQAAAEEELAHAEAVPTPSLVLGGYGTTGPAGIGLSIGLSVPLPVFDRNRAAIARARAGARGAILDRDATTFELTAELTRATRILAARRDALAKFETDAIGRLPKIRTMAEDAYKSGQGGIVELLDALDAITEAHLRDIDLLEAVLGSELDVRAAARGQ